MANFTVKTIKEIYDSFMAKYIAWRNKYGDNQPLLEKAVIKSIAYALASITRPLWLLAVWVYKQCYVQTADKDPLKMWGSLVGVDYNDGQTATVVLQINNVNADYLAAGTVYKELTSGLIYKTTLQTAANNNVITATAACTTPGSAGNLPIGTILNIANPLDGIPATAQIISISSIGSEDENIEIYRKRVISRFQNKSQGGSALDYYNWASEVAGIIDVFPYTLEEGKTTLFCVAEGSGNQRTPSGSITPNPFPIWQNGVFQDFNGSGQMLQIAKAVEGTPDGEHNRRPMGAKVEILPPNYTAYSIDILGLTDVSFNEAIKNVLVEALDKKRPHIKVLNYKSSNAKINKLSLSAEVSEIIGDATFTSFDLKNANNVSIDEDTLGVGCLAYLANLTINGVKVTI